MQRKKNSTTGITLILICIAFIFGCSEEKGPVRLGFIGGISGRNADLGQAGRNGAMLAVEEFNRAGGLSGRPIELVIRDDANEKEKAIAVARELIKEKVEAIIGAFTSTTTEAVWGVTEPAKMVLFSPTASSTRFSGMDDYFFRLCSTSTTNAEHYANFMVKRRGYHRISVAVDKKNYTFAKPFSDAYIQKVKELGGEIVAEVWYDTQTVTGFADLTRELLEPNPEVIMVIANAVDVARIAQQFRKVDTKTPIVAVEWAGTQQLIELGGTSVDGIELLQLFNMFEKGERYSNFLEAYRKRFSSDPSFSSILAYDTVQALIKAMKNRKKDQSLKAAILENSPYQGLQQVLKMDKFGDSRRDAYFVVVDGMKFKPAP